jgi:hypothetical protein
MSELPTLISLFTPPPEQKVEPGQPSDYVGVYCVGSHITVVTQQPPGFSFPKVELWRPIFDCAIPSEIQIADGNYFAIWFTGIPSERGRYGRSVREVRVTGITRSEQGRELRADEYVR